MTAARLRHSRPIPRETVLLLTSICSKGASCGLQANAVFPAQVNVVRQAKKGGVKAGRTGPEARVLFSWERSIALNVF